MSDPLKNMERLSRRARGEEAPEADVSARVLSRLGREERDPYSPPLVWLAAGSAAAAVVALLIGVSAYGDLNDPLLAMFQVTPIIWQ